MPALDYARYTVAWIAPLLVEAEAALGMLDNRHDGYFETIGGDDYDYIAGDIHGHNIVIATLPSGQIYGVGSAASLANQVKIRFTNLSFALLVGVAAGLPNLSPREQWKYRDIRLGDVLVCVPNKTNSGVVHYTLGRDQDGEFDTVGRLAETPLRVRAAIGRMELTEEDSYKQGERLAKQLDKFIKAKVNRGIRKFLHPGQDRDVLYPVSQDSTLETDPIFREPREQDQLTQVFYGTIGSGDVLMRNQRRRDELRDQYDLIGLEMEAAGVMNTLPTGIVRGVSDYADGHKTKEWQPYAAAVAAVYARGILSNIRSAREQDQIKPHRAEQLFFTDKESQGKLIQSLSFDRIEDRYNNIKAAHFSTCNWLLDHHKYIDWLDQSHVDKHHGILWLKGNPGSGKSTLMKLAFSRAKSSNHNDIRLSFFFNGRGSQLEKSTMGMYRSILYQLLLNVPELSNVFNTFHLLELPQKPQYNWTLSQLTMVLSRTIEMLEGRQLWIYIDALDECDEAQIRDMVRYFGLLGEKAAKSTKDIRIMFASRYYPQITMNKGIEMRLEDEQEHFIDIRTYIQSELRVGSKTSSAKRKNIQTEVERRAAGSFIWVVLAAQILNVAYDRGRVAALEKQLGQISNDLGELFEDILNRDTQDLGSMRLCIQWILFAKRPLSRKELYFAILSGSSLEDNDDFDEEELSDESMDAFILSCSKGLAELTRGDTPTFQFVHETIRDFFLKGTGMKYIYESSVGSPAGLAHDTLRTCCVNYIVSHRQTLEVAVGPVDYDNLRIYQQMYLFLFQTTHHAHRWLMGKWQEIIDRLAFIEYALLHVLFHADAAECNDTSQVEFLRTFQVRPWMLWRNLIQINRNPSKCSDAARLSKILLSADSNMLSISTELNLRSLVSVTVANNVGIEMKSGQYGSPLRAALILMHREALAALLTPDRSLTISESPDFPIHPTNSEIEGLIETYHYCYERELPTGSPMETFYRWGFESDIVVLLRSRRFDLSANISTVIPYPPLIFAADRGLERMTRFLLGENGVDCNVRGEHGLTPLAKAAQQGRLNIVSLLLQHSQKVDINRPSTVARSPLSYAAEHGHQRILNLLLNTSGIDVNMRDNKGRTPFFYAAQCGHEPIISTLLCVRGIDAVSKDDMNHTALSHAVLQGHAFVVQRLLQSNRVEINCQDHTHGKTALMLAVENGYGGIAKALLRYPGIDISLRDKRGRNIADYIARREEEHLEDLMLQLEV